MGGINTGRVIAGGLLAGLVFNIGETILNLVVLEGPMEEITKAHNMQEPSGAGIAAFVLMGFLLGILMVWLYAAVRPRLGPGPKTAAIVGAAIWFPASLLPTVGWAVFGLSPIDLAAIVAVWGLAELVLSALAGGWVYQEG